MNSDGQADRQIEKCNPTGTIVSQQAMKENADGQTR